MEKILKLEGQTGAIAILLYLLHHKEKCQTTKMFRGSDLNQHTGYRAIAVLESLGLITHEVKTKPTFTKWYNLTPKGRQAATLIKELATILDQA